MFYREGRPRPLPNPDRDCIIYMYDGKGKETFDRYVPRTRHPHGEGYIEHF